MAKVIEVIFTRDRRGIGTEQDPVRLVEQLWTLDGKLICEWDHHTSQPRTGPGWEQLQREPEHG